MASKLWESDGTVIGPQTPHCEVELTVTKMLRLFPSIPVTMPASNGVKCYDALTQNPYLHQAILGTWFKGDWQ